MNLKYGYLWSKLEEDKSVIQEFESIRARTPLSNVTTNDNEAAAQQDDAIKSPSKVEKPASTGGNNGAIDFLSAILNKQTTNIQINSCCDMDNCNGCAEPILEFDDDDDDEEEDQETEFKSSASNMPLSEARFASAGADDDSVSSNASSSVVSSSSSSSGSTVIDFDLSHLSIKIPEGGNAYNDTSGDVGDDADDEKDTTIVTEAKDVSLDLGLDFEKCNLANDNDKDEEEEEAVEESTGIATPFEMNARVSIESKCISPIVDDDIQAWDYEQEEQDEEQEKEEISVSSSGGSSSDDSSVATSTSDHVEDDDTDETDELDVGKDLNLAFEKCTITNGPDESVEEPVSIIPFDTKSRPSLEASSECTSPIAAENDEYASSSDSSTDDSADITFDFNQRSFIRGDNDADQVQDDTESEDTESEASLKNDEGCINIASNSLECLGSDEVIATKPVTYEDEDGDEPLLGTEEDDDIAIVDLHGKKSEQVHDDIVIDDVDGEESEQAHDDEKQMTNSKDDDSIASEDALDDSSTDDSADITFDFNQRSFIGGDDENQVQDEDDEAEASLEKDINIFNNSLGSLGSDDKATVTKSVAYEEEDGDKGDDESLLGTEEDDDIVIDDLDGEESEQVHDVDKKMTNSKDDDSISSEDAEWSDNAAVDESQDISIDAPPRRNEVIIVDDSDEISFEASEESESDDSIEAPNESFNVDRSFGTTSIDVDVDDAEEHLSDEIIERPTKKIDDFKGPDSRKAKGRRESKVTFVIDDSDDDTDAEPNQQVIQRIPRQKGPAKKKSINFKRNRDVITKENFKEFNKKVFKGALGAVEVQWSTRLTKTAGLTRLKRQGKGPDQRRIAAIELSTKLIDQEDRLRSTLMHEMCHAAAWLVDAVHKPPHGSCFKKWADTGMRKINGMLVTTTHSYVTNTYKFAWACTTEGCPVTYQRHSRSVDPDRHRCGKCKGKLIEIEIRGSSKDVSNTNGYTPKKKR